MNTPSTYYATIFDANYIVRTLALYDSIKPYLNGRIFTFFCVDQESADILHKMDLPHSHVVSPPDYESPVLYQLRKERARGPYGNLFPLRSPTSRSQVVIRDGPGELDTTVAAARHPAQDLLANVRCAPGKKTIC